MNRSEAAALLRVAEDASVAEVEQAFRKQAKAVHPDVAGPDAVVDFDRVRRARDLLIEPRQIGEPTPPRSEAPSEPRQPSRGAQPAEPGTSGSGWGIWLAAAVAAAMFIAIVVLVTLAVVMNDDDAQNDPAGAQVESPNWDCLLIEDDGGFTEVECDEPGAYVIAAVHPDRNVACAAQLTRLLAPEGTLCLRPVE